MTHAAAEDLGITLTLDSALDEAIERVTAALKDEHFGVLTRIDVHEAFREKLDKAFRPYVILGACNPPLAHAALTARPEVGLLLPCNVVVEEIGDRKCRVRIINAVEMMKAAGLEEDPDISRIGAEADAGLRRVAEALTT